MNPKTIVVFIWINFAVAFVSDIVLNDLSQHYGFVTSLQPYFHKQPIVPTACAAGLTIVSALLVTMVTSLFIFGFPVPSTLRELFYFSILAYGLGYIIDIAIYRLNVFGHRLDRFYKEVGTGFWGAVAFVFSIVTSYFVQKNLYLLV